ncbi:hydantoinase/oxoprolinase family protein [Streptomyces lomondensis]|uniref:Hydantoinase A/oxoprolinase domain-containing protein n=1 Tax=Streptomyces lomondensis TaxID=68229 RepID=A0ABQ2X7J0_9ACTN|nr:hydantoinase/oxoprolinase family protein [Streptomyces lomondensis]MCF0081430.1 hypothetical protein [Streptomyces lomondensis]GGX03052.1 hypothetical protein GCM10010383_36660 [Streptomyces lomondensis]
MTTGPNPGHRACRINELISGDMVATLPVGVLEAAWGIRQVLDSKMADLLRSVTIEKGHDPREFVLFAGGGQGPSHARALCRCRSGQRPASRPRSSLIP